MNICEVLDKHGIKLNEEQEHVLQQDLISVVKYDLTQGLNDILDRFMVPASSNQNATFYTFLSEYSKFIKNYGS